MVAESAHDLLLRELGRMNAELATQRRLTAQAVHDLASPAQVMLGLAELMLDTLELDPDARVRVEQMERTATTLSTLINDLRRGLDMPDEPELTLARTDLAEFVASVVETTRLLSTAKRIDLELVVDAPQPVWVDVDVSRLERALSNLLGNAIKYSPFRSRVTVSLARDGEAVTVSVQDEGPGIAAEATTRIFEVYHREEETAEEPGLGLGLHIVKQITEDHGGTVSVRSEPGAGSTFVLRLPLAGEPEETASSVPA